MRLLPLLLLATALGCEASGSPPPAAMDAGDAGLDGSPRPDAGPRDGGADAAWCGDLAICDDACVDTETDPAHCGACGTECEAPGDAQPTCEGGSCGFRCDNGFAEVDGACVPAPRLLWPPSLSTVTSEQPTLRWELPDGLTDSTVELCEDPGCGTVIESLDVSGVTEATPAAALSAGTVFWRVTADGRASKTWLFRLRALSPGTGLAWGVYPDYDRDGYGDIAVGAPRVDGEEGRAYLFLGTDEGTPAAVTTVLRSPDGPGAEFALAMACAGDLNGDGYADLAVGAPRAGDSAGRVHVLFGGPDGLGSRPDASIDSPEGPMGLFGGAVAGVGDVNGDGYGDLLVGAIGEGVTPGRAYLYRGTRLGIETSPARALTGGGRFASAVAGAGDVDGDGLSDVLIGAFGAAAGAGEVHLYLGTDEGIDVSPAATWTGPGDPGAQFGFSLAGIGDVNGDGYADFAVGAPAAETSKGHVFVYYGGDGTLPASHAVMLEGVNSGGGFFGHDVAGLGDGNGDGYSDLVVAAFGVDGRRGRVSVILGNDSGPSTTERTNVEGLGTGDDFGWSVSSAGDVDGNGSDDLVVGAPGTDDRGGRAYVYRGGPAGVGSSALRTLVGPSGGAFGRAVGHAER